MPQYGKARNRGQSLRKAASSRSGRRVRKFEAPKPTLFRRILRLIFNPVTFAIVAFSLLGVFLVASYFWFEFSDKINRMLAGDVFTRNAGIYSAPKTIRKGESITDDELIDYLRSAGYAAANDKADPLRSKYEINGSKLSIEPGVTAVHDGKVEFRTIDVLFDKKGEKVEKITDKRSGDELAKTALEPKLLSAVAREGDGQRKVVTFKDLPPNLIKAITVTEDRGFFDHWGVNFRGIARALWARYDGEDSNAPIENQGGSSITQQLVKNLFLTPERTWERKAREAYMSIILETRLTKEEIFELYANQIYLGQDNGVSIYGVGEASKVYFGKDVSSLSLPESAFIAGIIRSPNRYQPYKEPKKAKERRNQVIQSMLEAGEISASHAKAAKESPLSVTKPAARVDQQGMEYFAQYAVEQLPKVVNDPDALQHLRVFTSIDPDLQKIAHGALTKQLSKLEKYYKDDRKKNLNGALVALRPKTGEIVAMIGGKDYADNQFNRAADAMRQPGSVFKPFVYASAINTAYLPNSRVLTPASVFKDEKKVFTFNQDSYSPDNYGDYFSNKELTLRDALVKSKNVITVDIAMELNVGTVMNLARKAGLPKVDRAYPSMALGTAEATPLQMAEAYTMFANLGDVVEPIAINRIATGDGKTIAAPVGQKRNVLRPDVSYVLVDMMKDVVNRGTAAGLSAWGIRNEKAKKGFAGKTGTSRDGWFVGFTPEILVAVYVGFDDGSDLRIDGSDSAMPIWAEFMKEALRLHPEWYGDWQEPGGIRKAEIDIRTGALIRELGPDGEAAEPTPTPTPAYPVDPDLVNTLPPDLNSEIYVTDIPKEFRRVELFIVGTVPNRMLKDDYDSEFPDGIDPNASPTPFTTWEQAEEESEPEPARGQPQAVGGEVPIVLCPLSGKRATANCPERKVRKFKVGTEPTDFCEFHVGSN
ncbi:MAG: PBP1A family penicillin-binding protein [Acidobacteria bacterium]|nr:MAG: PBP1A family penicillin-binding protein [Acidobacteriota bacterium]REK02273.1 MAG: PBP1A family penicillin-binding protein [Acidobacteriota bacterium]REK13924.1 MAG: PBP1A family penicillin-binding protein [Acidobacteriota bacterium]REK41918.1 MAG: PBP1A family penicillin-binding protein [Acidobacteriota bacterium]